MIMPGEARPPRSIPRLARLLLGRNTLRRPSDRREGAILVMVTAVFCVAVVAASVLGTHIYRWQRADAARLRPAVAVLSRTGPTDNLGGNEEAWARWRAPHGRQPSGTPTIATPPPISDPSPPTPATRRVTPTAQPAPPPPR